MRKVRDLTGQTFGKLTVVSLLPTRTKSKHTQWRCRCACGGWSPCVTSSNLKTGNTASCGCDQKRRASEVGRANRTHGLTGQTGNAHYSRWKSVKARTGNSNHKSYQNYGGRGIKLHDPWVEDFISFKTWLDENLGPCPDGHSLDRIDNDGNYEPNNLRWATQSQQERNKR